MGAQGEKSVYEMGRGIGKFCLAQNGLGRIPLTRIKPGWTAGNAYAMIEPGVGDVHALG